MYKWWLLRQPTYHEVKLSLMDDSGVFMETPSVKRCAQERDDTELLEKELEYLKNQNDELLMELRMPRRKSPLFDRSYLRLMEVRLVL